VKSGDLIGTDDYERQESKKSDTGLADSSAAASLETGAGSTKDPFNEHTVWYVPYKTKTEADERGRRSAKVA
jgi:hypothetical protein